jgi:excisionase family DNA binding protein
MTKVYLRSGEVAQRLGVSLTTVRMLVQRGVLPALRVCKHLSFRPEDVEAYLVAARVGVHENESE